MLIGYARVSTVDQNLALQRDALTAAGCERVFTDEGVSGSDTARRGLDGALAALGPGDTLVVWKLDRLGRSLSHLVSLIAELGARRVNFRSLSDPIDTASSGGRLVMHIMGALAEFERGLIVERTQAGIQAAKKRGVQLGRRPSLAPAQVDHLGRSLSVENLPVRSRALCALVSPRSIVPSRILTAEVPPTYKSPVAIELAQTLHALAALACARVFGASEAGSLMRGLRTDPRDKLPMGCGDLP